MIEKKLSFPLLIYEEGWHEVTGWCCKSLTVAPPPTKVDPSSERRGKEK
jgi:hypothetical protein